MHRSRQLVFVCLSLVFAVVVSACSEPAASIEDAEEPNDSSTTIVADVSRTTGVPRMRPTSAQELGIALSPDGRPYDNYWGPQGTTVEQRLLTKLNIDRGRLEILDGDALDGPALITIRNTESVNYATAEQLDIRLYWQQFTDAAAVESMQGLVPNRVYQIGTGPDGEMVEAIIGVEISVPGTTVAQWSRFELAYESQIGIGAITSRLAIELAGRDFEFGDAIVEELLPEGRPYKLADIDGQPGNDLFLFDNGAARGGESSFELTEGFDENGQLASVMLWSPRFPWRLAVEDGIPPADITEREDELIDCIEGRRLIDKWGRCT